MADDDEPVPRLPRTRGFKLSTPAMVRIGLTGALLVLIIIVQRPCADSVSKFVTSFSDEGSAAATMPKPGTVDQPGGPGSAGDYVQLRGDMTPEQLKAAIDEARAKAAQRAGQGSGSGSAGSAAP